MVLNEKESWRKHKCLIYRIVHRAVQPIHTRMAACLFVQNVRMSGR